MLAESRNPNCALQLAACLISAEQHLYLTHFNLEWNGYFLLQKVSPASQMALGTLPVLARVFAFNKAKPRSSRMEKSWQGLIESLESFPLPIHLDATRAPKSV